MLPMGKGRIPTFTLYLDVDAQTTVLFELRTSNLPDNHTPDVVLAKRAVVSEPGSKIPFVIDFEVEIDEPRYVFVCVMRNEHVSVHCSELRLTGVLSVCNRFDPAVSNYGIQRPPVDIGVETFEMWCPERRPSGQNFAFEINPPLRCFGSANVSNGIARPTSQPNAWVADPADARPTLTVRWNEPQSIARIELGFDTDFDHPMESVLMGHPERVIPFCAKDFTVLDGSGTELACVCDNHETQRTIRFERPVTTDALSIRIGTTHGAPAALFDLRCYAE
jgi:hypothetical protein